MIVITAPTGQIGSQLVSNLLDSGESLRLIARDPSRLPVAVRKHAEVVEGSHADAAVVDKAFTDADAVFWLQPSDLHAIDARGTYLDFVKPAARAIAAHGVRRVVAVAAVGRGFTDDAGLVSLAWEAVDLLADTGVDIRELAMPTFMDNLLWQADSIAEQGVYYEPDGSTVPRPICATRDIAAVAAELLTDPSWTGRSTRQVLGPQDLTVDQKTMIISEVLDRDIECRQLAPEEYREQLITGGYSPSMAQAMVAMAEAKTAGLDSHHPRTVESTTPTSFRTWCAEVLRPAVER